jgi:hypothetical protein
MANKLRILYKNLLTAATAGGVSAPNLLTDTKSQTASGTTFVLTTTSVIGPVAVIAVLAENPGSVTMTVTGQTALTEATTTEASGNASGYGGVKYVAKYFTLASGTTSFTVTFNQSVKVSRFIVGNYWEPKYNTSFGISVGYEDATQFERLQSGDLYATLAPRYKTLSFELQYVDASEKFKLYEILRGIGKTKPIFISAFPDQLSDQEQEQMYSIYGRLTSLPPISYRIFTIYSSQFEVQEF